MVKKMPVALCQATALTHLDLSHNVLKDLPGDLEQVTAVTH
jgi:hypothetical protein